MTRFVVRFPAKQLFYSWQSYFSRGSETSIDRLFFNYSGVHSCKSSTNLEGQRPADFDPSV